MAVAQTGAGGAPAVAQAGSPSALGTPPANAAETGAAAETAGTPPASESGIYRHSPALTEIAEWLTKIIVGVGLIQARDIGTGFVAIVTWLLRDTGLSRFPGAGAVVPGTLVGGLIGGFILAYLMMSLVIGPEIAKAAAGMESAREEFLAGQREEKERQREEKERQRKAEEELKNAFTTVLRAPTSPGHPKQP